MNASDASDVVPDEVLNDAWEELMGQDLMMMKYTSDSCPTVFRNLPSLDTDLCIDHNQDCAEIGDYAIISYVGYFSKHGEIPIDDTEQLKKDLESPSSQLVKFVQAYDWIIKLGSGNVIPALEMATRFLAKGESAIVKSHSKYGYCNGRVNNCQEDNCHQDLPANTDVLFQITLRDIIPLGKAFNLNFRLKLGIHLKVMGNDAFKYEWIPSNQGGNGRINALKLYGDASQELMSILKDDKNVTSHDSMDEEMKLQCIKNLVDCFNNIASVHLRSKEYGKAKEAATEAIKIDPDNVKALCKAAKASLMMTNFKECKAVLDVLQNLDGTNKDFLRLRKDYNHSRSVYKKNEKKLYSKMMAHVVQATETKSLSKETNTNVIPDTVHVEQDIKNTVIECKESPLSRNTQIFLFLIVSIILWLYLRYKTDAATYKSTDL